MAAAWTVTRDEFKKEFPHAELPITQGAFMQELRKAGIAEPDPASAGYHDLSGALDIETVDLSDAERKGLIRIARSIGWAAWLRGPGLPGDFKDKHAHLALLGEPEIVDGKQYVDDGLINQMKAYKREGGKGCCGHGGNGLTGDSARVDPHPRPHPIPVFDYEVLTSDDIKKIVTAVLEAPISDAITTQEGDTKPLEAVLANDRKRLRGVEEKVDEILTIVRKLG
jgi:hypothetical protein